MSIRGNIVSTIRKIPTTLGTRRNLKQFEGGGRKEYAHGHFTFRSAALAVRCGSGLFGLRLFFSDRHRIRRQHLRLASGFASAGARGAPLAGKCGLSPSALAPLCLFCRGAPVGHPEPSVPPGAPSPPLPLL